MLRLGPRMVAPSARHPLLMAVVNASPESFSDGGSIGDLDSQAARARAAWEEGAGLIDVGGESGVTDRPPVTVEEEIRRVEPLVERLAADGFAVSVDTWKPAVARAAIGAGAVMVNDISGLADPRMADVCAEGGASLVLMHTRATPKRKEFPSYGDVMNDVVEFLEGRIVLARDHGLDEEQLVLDPGPDFAKTPAQTVEVLRRLGELSALGRPILLAASRKDFVGALTGRPPSGRGAGTLAAIGAGLDAGASILRVHDVPATRDFLRVRGVLRGDEDVPSDVALDPTLRREPRVAAAE